MAKKVTEEQAARREALQQRRQELLERKQADQMRGLRYALYGAGGLIGLIILTGLIFEFLVTPNRAVAEAGGTTITLAEWQDVVRYQRAQLINGIEDQYDLFIGIDESEDGEAEEPTEEDRNQALRG